MDNFKISVLKAEQGGFNYYVNNQWMGWCVSRNSAFKLAMNVVETYQA